MLDLREFTVAELSEHANASESTVRTVLRRNPDLAAGGATDKRGRRGGAYVRHQLRPGAAERIRTELGEVVGQSEPPPDLLAAEAMLLDELPGETDPAVREYLRRRAETLLDRVVSDLESSPGERFHPDAAAHSVAVRLLLRLEDAERLAEGGRTEAVKAWRSLARDLQRARRQLNAVNDGSLYAEIDGRIMGSQLAEPIETEAREDHSFAYALTAMARQCSEQMLKQSSASAGLVGMAGDLERAASGLAALAAELDRDLVLIFSGRQHSAPKFAGALASSVAYVDGRRISIAMTAGTDLRVRSSVHELVTRPTLSFPQPASKTTPLAARQKRHYVPFPWQAEPAVDRERANPIDDDKAMIMLVA